MRVVSTLTCTQSFKVGYQLGRVLGEPSVGVVDSAAVLVGLDAVLVNDPLKGETSRPPPPPYTNNTPSCRRSHSLRQRPPP